MNLTHPLARVLVFDRFTTGGPIGQAASSADAQALFGVINIAGDCLMIDSQTGECLGEIEEQ